MKKIISIILTTLLLLTSCNSIVSTPDDTTEVLPNQPFILQCYGPEYGEGFEGEISEEDSNTILSIWNNYEHSNGCFDNASPVRFIITKDELVYEFIEYSFNDKLLQHCKMVNNVLKIRDYAFISNEDAITINEIVLKYIHKTEDTTVIMIQPASPASPYTVNRTDGDANKTLLKFIRFINDAGYMVRSDKYDIRSGITPFTTVSGTDITTQHGAVYVTSEAMERAGYTTIWIGGYEGGSYFVVVSGVFYKLTVPFHSELKFICPIDLTGDGDYEILYYCERGNFGTAYNQLRFIDTQHNWDTFLADDIFTMNFELEYDEYGNINSVSLLGKNVKEIINELGNVWHINEDEEILALRGPSPWLIDAKNKPSTKELNEETSRMYNILKRDGYMTTSGWKSAEEVKPYLTAVLNLDNPTPDSFRLNEDYTIGFELNSKGFAILTADVGTIHHIFFFDKSTGMFYRPNIDGIDDIWMAKPIDINEDGNLDIVYYGPVSSSNIYQYRLVVYDLVNNKAQYIARAGKFLPVTYDKDHIYLGGIDIVEYYKTMEIPTKDYYQYETTIPEETVRFP